MYVCIYDDRVLNGLFCVVTVIIVDFVLFYKRIFIEAVYTVPQFYHPEFIWNFMYIYM